MTMIMKTALRRITLWFLVVTALFAASFKQVDAGDFMLIAASHNHTIFAGSMSKALADLTALPLEGVELPQALDYDPAEKMVYWTHYHSGPANGKLSRAHLNGTNQMTLLSDIRVAFGLALDLVARLVYWTDHTLGQIGRVSMDGSGAKEIIVEDLGSPRGIAIDHGQGHIYWTDVGNDIIDPKIERANLDGTNRITLVDNNLAWPQAVIINREANYLYWCDGHLDKIEQSNLLGNNRELVINLTKYAPIHPFDMVIYNDYIYWSDLSYSGIIRVHLNGRGERNYSPSIFPEIRRIHIETEPNYCDSSPCHNGATCEDIVNGFVCHCLSSFSGVTCSEYPCSSLPCLNGGICSSSSDVFTCQCPPPYEGPTCALDSCSSSPCLNGGICSISSAVFTCQCPPPYEGPTCALDLCSSSPCLNGGMCSISPAGFTCRCPPLYEGPTCALDPCRSSPCVNGGMCSISPVGFTCQCPPLYNGPTCALVAGCLAPSLSHHVVLLEDVGVFAPGEEATFTCDSGYYIKGSSGDNVKHACLSDNTWSGEPVQCYKDEENDGSTLPVVPIAAGGGVAAIVIVLLIIVIVVVKMKKKRNDRERVVNVPPVIYHSRIPPPAYQFDQSTAYMYVQQTSAGGGINNTGYNNMADGTLNANIKPPLTEPLPVYEEVPN